jgi:hypothetical protein
MSEALDKDKLLVEYMKCVLTAMMNNNIFYQSLVCLQFHVHTFQILYSCKVSTTENKT